MLVVLHCPVAQAGGTSGEVGCEPGCGPRNTATATATPTPSTMTTCAIPPEEWAARRERQPAVGARRRASGGVHDLVDALVARAGIGDRHEIDIGAFAARHGVSDGLGLGRSLRETGCYGVAPSRSHPNTV
jgi:hypothetical protein